MLLRNLLRYWIFMGNLRCMGSAYFSWHREVEVMLYIEDVDSHEGIAKVSFLSQKEEIFFQLYIHSPCIMLGRRGRPMQAYFYERDAT